VSRRTALIKGLANLHKPCTPRHQRNGPEPHNRTQVRATFQTQKRAAERRGRDRRTALTLLKSGFVLPSTRRALDNHKKHRREVNPTNGGVGSAVPPTYRFARGSAHIIHEATRGTINLPTAAQHNRSDQHSRKRQESCSRGVHKWMRPNSGCNGRAGSRDTQRPDRQPSTCPAHTAHTPVGPALCSHNRRCSCRMRPCRPAVALNPQDTANTSSRKERKNRCDTAYCTSHHITSHAAQTIERLAHRA
jgi:hypothetical protein